MPRLSIVIPVLGRLDVLEPVLDELERQEAQEGDFEVLVIADAAEEDKPRVSSLVADRPYPTRALPAAIPGASASRNLGWREARAPVVLFLGADILPAPTLVAEHLAWHDRHPDERVGVLGRVRWARELKLTPFMRWLDDGVQFDYDNIPGEEAAWGQFYTANVSLKRSLLDRSGGFDQERFPFHYEDTELAYRLDKLGFRLLYNRDALGEHLHSKTLEDFVPRMAAVAPFEHRFVTLHPDQEPWLYNRFRWAAILPPPRGRTAPISRFVPRWVPWLGPRLWRSVRGRFDHAVAPAYVAAYEASQEAASAAPPPARS